MGGAREKHEKGEGGVTTGGDVGGAGTLALVGAGEYLAEMEPVDRLLLERVRGSLRAVVLPTAAAPDGRAVAERWARMGVEHFTRMGVYVEPAMVLTRADAESHDLARQIAAATFVYLSGGKPGYLVKTLRGSACWDAIVGVYRQGGVIAGCSAGAMALGSRVFAAPRFFGTLPGLGLASDFAVVPHADGPPRWLLRLAVGTHRKLPVVRIDDKTALISSEGEWFVAGRGAVMISLGRHATRYTSEQRVRLIPVPLAAR